MTFRSDKKNRNVVYSQDRRMFIRSSLGLSIAIPFLPSLLAFEDRLLASPDASTLPGSAFFFYAASGFPHHRMMHLDPSNFALFKSHRMGSRSLKIVDIKGILPKMLQILSPHAADLAVHVGATYVNLNFRHGDGLGHEPSDDRRAPGLFRAMTGFDGGYMHPGIKSAEVVAAQAMRLRSDSVALRYDIVDLSQVLGGMPATIPGLGDSSMRVIRPANYQNLRSSLFGGISGADPNASRLIQNESSVLAALMETYSQVKNTIGASDRVSMEAHFDSLSNIAKQSQILDKCTIPPEMSAIPSYDPGIDSTKLTFLINELCASAIACGLVRVFHYNIGPFSTPWHNSSHGVTDASSNYLFNGLNNIHIATMGHLATLLKNRVNPTTGRTLFAETTMSLNNELNSTGAGGLAEATSYTSDTHVHSPFGAMMVLLGGANGRLQSGQVVDWFNYSAGRYPTGARVGLCAQQQQLASYLQGAFDAHDLFVNQNFGDMGPSIHKDFPGWSIPDVSVTKGRVRDAQLENFVTGVNV